MSVADLESTLGHDEWVRWVAFHALYDLPDGFLVAGQLGEYLARVTGNPQRAQHFAPFFAPPPRPAGDAGHGLRAAFAFLKAHVPHKRREPE